MPESDARSGASSTGVIDSSCNVCLKSYMVFAFACVVGQLDQDLIGRVPGGGPDSHAKSRGRKPKKTLTFSSES